MYFTVLCQSRTYWWWQTRIAENQIGRWFSVLCTNLITAVTCRRLRSHIAQRFQPTEREAGKTVKATKMDLQKTPNMHSNLTLTKKNVMYIPPHFTKPVVQDTQLSFKVPSQVLRAKWHPDKNGTLTKLHQQTPTFCSSLSASPTTSMIWPVVYAADIVSLCTLPSSESCQQAIHVSVWPSSSSLLCPLHTLTHYVSMAVIHVCQQAIRVFVWPSPSSLLYPLHALTQCVSMAVFRCSYLSYSNYIHPPWWHTPPT